VIYHIHTHHRQVGTYDDAATARRGERLRTFMARTLTQQFAQAARFEAARRERTARIQGTSSQNTFMRQPTDPSWVYGYDAWTAPLPPPP